MIINPYILNSVDADAQAFITAASITDTTQKSAVNTLVIDLKSYGIWNKMKAIYPFVGGTATTHKWNLKNPLDTNAAFRLTFNGGWTHSSTGATPNGVNGNANTNILGNTDIVKGNAGLGLYFRTNNANNSAFGIDSNFHIHPMFSNGFTYWRICNSTGQNVNTANSLGLFHGYSNGTNTSTSFRNGTLINTYIGNTNIAALNLYFGGGFNVFQQDNREIAFGFVSGGLSNTEASDLYTVIQNFNTTLGRQV